MFRIFKQIISYCTTIIFLLVVLQSTAQTSRPLPANYTSGASINYVRTWDALAPETDAANLVLTTSPDKARITTQYFDGLGRPIQTVMKQGSMITGGTPTDMVNTHLYDEFGREQFKYLPSPSNNTGGNSSINDGLFKLNPFQQQAAFYNSSNSNSPLYDQGETYFYSQTNFEPSLVNQVQESFASGNSWVGTAVNATESTRKSVKAKYYINSITDGVRIALYENIGSMKPDKSLCIA